MLLSDNLAIPEQLANAALSGRFVKSSSRSYTKSAQSSIHACMDAAGGERHIVSSIFNKPFENSLGENPAVKRG